MSARIAVAAVATWLLSSGLARAHGVLEEGLSLRLQGHLARGALVLPAAALEVDDLDGDGQLSGPELQAQEARALAILDSTLGLEGATRSFGDLLPVGGHGHGEVPGGGPDAPRVLVMLQYRWPAAPDAVVLHSRLPAEVGALPVHLHDAPSARTHEARLVPGAGPLRFP